jgi:hypothetical protein
MLASRKGEKPMDSHASRTGSHVVLAGLFIGVVAVIAASAPLKAQSGNNPAPRTITVSGQGEARAVPDEAQLSAGVLATARTAAEALAANTRAMNGVFASLRKMGIPEKSMQTSEFSVTPQYQTDHNGNQTQKIVSYQVTNTVAVTVDDLTKLGPALDALVSSGSNSLGNVAFTIRDPKPLMSQARAAAMRDAIDRAAIYAKAAGIQLGPIASINESGEETPRPVYMKAMSMAAGVPASPPPVAAGEDSVSAGVNVTFLIR